MPMGKPITFELKERIKKVMLEDGKIPLSALKERFSLSANTLAKIRREIKKKG